MLPKVKKLLAICFAVFLVVACVVPVSAATKSYEIENAHLNIEIPDNFYAFTPETSIFDESWMLIGVTDPTSKLKEYKEMGTLVHLATAGGKENILISTKTSSYTKEIFSFVGADEETFRTFMDDMISAQDENENLTATAERYNDAAYPFVRVEFLLDSDSDYLREVCYVTVINGSSYSFDMYSAGKKLGEDEEAILREIVNSAEFTQILDNTPVDYTPKQIFLALLPLIVLILAIIALIVGFAIRRKQQKKKRADLAARLSEYRIQKKKEAEENPDAPEPEERFRNSTIHSDQALHTFSYFHSYWKNPLTIPVFALCGLAAIWLAITSTMGDSIIFRLLFAAAGIYLIVHIFTAPGTIYKSLFRTYKKMPNRVAVFSFRDEDFRLSGLQASGVFPYFQITTAYETKNYFYLYFGRENAYFVAKDNFKVGDAKAFRAFLKEKLGKNFKRRTF